MKALTTRRTFLIVMFIGLFAMAARNVVDPDVWWHLKTGEIIYSHHAVPHTDPFSYTRAGQRWVAHEWLSESFLYGVYRLGGAGGLIAIFAAIITAAFVLLYLRCGPAPYIAGLATLCGAWATVPVWGVRPQVLSLLLTSLWLLIIERSEHNPRFLFWTIPVTLLWVNLHAGFCLGLAISALYLIGWMIEPVLDKACPRPPWKVFVLVLFLDLVLVRFNPNGFHLFSYALETLRSSAMQSYIAEWASPNFHSPEHWSLTFIILATFTTLFFSRNRLRPRDLLLLLVSLYACLASVRMVPFFVLTAVPLVARRLGTWPALGTEQAARARTAFNAVIVLTMTLFAAVHITRVIQHQSEAQAERFPASAVEFLRSHPPSGHLFNHYDWGGYLIWRLPSTPVFIDGRADVYGEAVLNDFATIYQLKPLWRQTLDRWHVQTVLVPARSPLATALLSSRDWVVSYRDSQAIVLTSSLR